MDKPTQIRQRIKELATEVGPAATMLAKVVSVNEGAQTCTLKDDDTELEYFDVRLRPVVDGKKSFAFIPKVNTWALAVRIEGEDDWMVVAVGEINKCLLSASQVVFNEGTFGGLIKIEELKSELDKVNEILQSLMAVISGTPIPEPGNSAPSALQTSLNAAIAGKTLPTYLDIENTKIKH